MAERDVWEILGGEELFQSESLSDKSYHNYLASLCGGETGDYSRIIFPDYYGGAYINRLGNLVMYTTEINEANKKDIYERIGTDKVVIKKASKSFNDLIRIQDTIMKYKQKYLHRNNPVADNIISCEIRDMQNLVGVTMEHADQISFADFQNEVLKDDGILFLQNSRASGNQSNVDCGSHAPYGSSMAYRAKLNGNAGFVTAAHGVGQVNSIVRASDNSSVIGTVKARREEGSTDAAFIQTNSSYVPTNTITSGGTLGLTPWDPVAGATVFKIGHASGLTCGYITSTSYVYTDNSGVTWVLVKTADIGGLTGDSGGLVYRVIAGGYYAAGVWKGVNNAGFYVYSKASAVNGFLNLSRY